MAPNFDVILNMARAHALAFCDRRDLDNDAVEELVATMVFCCTACLLMRESRTPAEFEELRKTAFRTPPTKTPPTKT
jgi:hypothetical protein